MSENYADHDMHINIRSTVTENRAPTDESVRLLKEMEEAARKKVIESVRIENTPIKCVVHMMHDHFSDQRKIAVHLTINGHRIEHITTVRMPANRTEAFIQVAEELGKRIAAEALGPAFTESLGKFSTF